MPTWHDALGLLPAIASIELTGISPFNKLDMLRRRWVFGLFPPQSPQPDHLSGRSGSWRMGAPYSWRPSVV